MKGLNDMKFGTGDVVRINFDYSSKELAGTIGIVREIETSTVSSYATCIIEALESIVYNPLVLTNGIWINGIRVLDKDLMLLDCTTDEEEEILAKIRNQRINNKHNTWEVRIRQCDDDKNFTCAELYVNGRFETVEYVKRYYKDKYNAGTACIEVCKKLFGVENAEGKSKEILMPKYYTGKVVCVERNPWFTQGKVYEVEDGNVIDDQGSIYGFIEGVNDMCDQIKVEFIEFVE
uniref:Uncharacterized protein n=1 Tax=Siphoviridae sp. ctBCr48 TaxID=2827802 RepID=A0A8S5SHS9_9CAUD|nr:MAG TPA: hypothetical protein [Siphoviridae sp. ctBCr48]